MIQKSLLLIFFLECNCARAIASVDQWLSQCIVSSTNLKQGRMCFLQTIFTILWSIWNHRNMVLHQGLSPNPIEVILISQSLMCRYQTAFSQRQNTRPSEKQTLQRIPHQNWQILIKVAASRNRKTKRFGFAFEATSMAGVTIFRGAANNGRQSIYMVTQEAMVEAIFKAKRSWFQQNTFCATIKSQSKSATCTANPHGKIKLSLLTFGN